MAKVPQQNYTDADLLEAVRCINEGRMSIREAAKTLSIPKTTLSRKKDDVIIEKGRKGPQTILTSEEEESLVVWLESCMRRGFPRPHQSLLEEVQKILKADGRRRKTCQEIRS